MAAFKRSRDQESDATEIMKLMPEIMSTNRVSRIDI